ncbi:MAG: cysteine methyltransferase, partial [Calditrichaeota bacterium]
MFQDNTYQAHYHSPIGWLHIRADEGGIREIRFAEAPLPEGSPEHPLLAECIRQLEEYFGGE